MTDDIVARLRKEENSEWATHPAGLLDQAADEIERLRVYESLHAKCDETALSVERKLVDRLSKMHAEIERLRAALLFYADRKNWSDGESTRTPNGAYIVKPDSVGADFGDKARAALTPEKTDD